MTGRRPYPLWHTDLSVVPTSLGSWTSWLPRAMPQRGSLWWWVAVAVDHFSRSILGTSLQVEGLERSRLVVRRHPARDVRMVMGIA